MIESALKSDITNGNIINDARYRRDALFNSYFSSLSKSSTLETLINDALVDNRNIESNPVTGGKINETFRVPNCLVYPREQDTDITSLVMSPIDVVTCPVIDCHKRFKTSGNLKRHLQVPHNIRPYDPPLSFKSAASKWTFSHKDAKRDNAVRRIEDFLSPKAMLESLIDVCYHMKYTIMERLDRGKYVDCQLHLEKLRALWKYLLAKQTHSPELLELLRTALPGKVGLKLESPVKEIPDLHESPYLSTLLFDKTVRELVALACLLTLASDPEYTVDLEYSCSDLFARFQRRKVELLLNGSPRLKYDCLCEAPLVSFSVHDTIAYTGFPVGKDRNQSQAFDIAAIMAQPSEFPLCNVDWTLEDLVYWREYVLFQRQITEQILSVTKSIEWVRDQKCGYFPQMLSSEPGFPDSIPSLQDSTLQVLRCKSRADLDREGLWEEVKRMSLFRISDATAHNEDDLLQKLRELQKNAPHEEVFMLVKQCCYLSKQEVENVPQFTDTRILAPSQLHYFAETAWLTSNVIWKYQDGQKTHHRYPVSCIRSTAACFFALKEIKTLLNDKLKTFSIPEIDMNEWAVERPAKKDVFHSKWKQIFDPLKRSPGKKGVVNQVILSLMSSPSRYARTLLFSHLDTFCHSLEILAPNEQNRLTITGREESFDEYDERRLLRFKWLCGESVELRNEEIAFERIPLFYEQEVDAISSNPLGQNNEWPIANNDRFSSSSSPGDEISRLIDNGTSQDKLEWIFQVVNSLPDNENDTATNLKRKMIAELLYPNIKKQKDDINSSGGG